MIHGTRESKILGRGGCFVRLRDKLWSRLVLDCLRVVVDVFEVVVEFFEVVVGGCGWF